MCISCLFIINKFFVVIFTGIPFNVRAFRINLYYKWHSAIIIQSSMMLSTKKLKTSSALAGFTASTKKVPGLCP